MEESMGNDSARDADTVRELMRRVKAVYPLAFMEIHDTFKTFPPSYAVRTGEPYRYKEYPLEPTGFMMGYGDSPKEAWTLSWETVEELMLHKLCE